MVQKDIQIIITTTTIIIIINSGYFQAEQKAYNCRLPAEILDRQHHLYICKQIAYFLHFLCQLSRALLIMHTYTMLTGCLKCRDEAILHVASVIFYLEKEKPLLHYWWQKRTFACSSYFSVHQGHHWVSSMRLIKLRVLRYSP